MFKVKKGKKCLLILLIFSIFITMFCGCGKNDDFIVAHSPTEALHEDDIIAENSQEETETPANTEVPDAVRIDNTAEKTTDSISGYEQGSDVYADGKEIATYKIDNVLYSSFSDFAEGLGEILSAEEYRFTFNNQECAFTSDSAKIEVDGSDKTMSSSSYMFDGELYIPVEDASKILGLTTYKDSDTGITYYSSKAYVNENVKGKTIPVISFSGVLDAANTTFEYNNFVALSEFEQMLQFLTNNGYTCITFEDMYRIDDIEKPVILLFDSGYANNYTTVFPMISQYNVPITLCLSAGLTDTEGYVTTEQIKEMSDSGLVSVQSAGVTRNYFSQMLINDVKSELESSKIKITKITGKIPFVICYPHMDATSSIVEAAQEYYCYGVQMHEDGVYNKWNNLMTISRICTGRQTLSENFEYWLSSFYAK